MRKLGDILAGLFIPLCVAVLVVLAVSQYIQARAELEQIKSGDTGAMVQ